MFLPQSSGFRYIDPRSCTQYIRYSCDNCTVVHYHTSLNNCTVVHYYTRSLLLIQQQETLHLFADQFKTALVLRFKTPSQLKGERYLRSKNLLVPPSTQRNIERVKLKARALRLKEEYRNKYLTKRRFSAARRDASVAPAPTVPELSEDSITVPDYIESTPSRLRRTLTFCITLWFSFLIAIAICTLTGYSYKYILLKYYILISISY